MALTKRQKEVLDYLVAFETKHGYAPSPFAMAGSGIRPVGKLPYSEANAGASGLKLEKGHELMEYFLRGGGE